MAHADEPRDARSIPPARGFSATFDLAKFTLTSGDRGDRFALAPLFVAAI